MKDMIELWLCEDCMVLNETGDASSFDYHYDTRHRDENDMTEADRRLASCERGLDRLSRQGMFVNDECEEVQLICSDCGHIILQADAEYTIDEWDEKVPVCPKCGSLEMSARESGYDEFSRAGCDCCDSTLAGSLHRYALFPKETVE